MAVYKEKKKNGQTTWRVVYRYRDLTTSKWRQTTKRGFPSQIEALTYEQRKRMSANADMHMSFKVFYEECYKPEALAGFKPTTLKTKDSIIETHVYPFFEDIPMDEITPRHILAWKNRLMLPDEEGNVLSREYLRTTYSTLRAVFNHAEKFYPSYVSPMSKTSNFPKTKVKGKKIWTLEEYYKFASCLGNDDEPILSMFFEVLMFTGLRISECLALCVSDVQGNIISITKNLQRINGEDLILTPKTLASDRKVVIPPFLEKNLCEYISRLPIQDSDARLFPISRNSIYRSLKKYSELAQVPQITPHGFRHSYITMMIHNKCDPTDLCPFTGHNKVETLYHYTHPYLDRQFSAVNKLNDQWLEISGREV